MCNHLFVDKDCEACAKELLEHEKHHPKYVVSCSVCQKMDRIAQEILDEILAEEKSTK